MTPRKGPRFAVQLPLKAHDASAQWRGTVVNVSDDGCAVLTDSCPVVGSYWTLRIETAQPDQTVDVELAAVRWQAADRCGLEFIKIRQEKKTVLHGFVGLLAGVRSERGDAT